MKNKIFVISALFFFVFAPSVNADNNSVISAYRKFKDIDDLSIKVPTVVEVSLADQFIERFNFAVQDKTSNSFEPYYFNQKILKFDTPIGVNTDPLSMAGLMSDGNTSTYAEFSLPANAQGFTNIVLLSQEPVTSSAVTAILDNYVALPNYIEITATVNGQEKVVLAKKEMDQNTIHFPKTTSSKWVISYWYSQPLRITEFKLIQEDNSKNTLNSVRFLAQPGHSYLVYFDPDRYVTAPVGEAANLSIAKEVMNLSNIPAQNNPDYVIADTDNDGVPDIEDNCTSFFNSDQADVNGNSRGDVCDDFDQDGLLNVADNCPDNPNWDQRDTDGDGIGDTCDGEESRLTEQHPWVPWVGIGFAALVLISLFVMTARSSSSQKTDLNIL